MKRLVIAAILALSPMMAQAELLGVSLNGANNGNYGPSSLYVIDPVTGAGTVLISDLGYAVNSIAVDPTTGTLYASTTAWNEGGDNFNGLLQINLSTGAVTEVGPFGGGFYAILALTFDSSGNLWGWHDPFEDDPVTIDKNTGAATTVGDAGLSTAEQVLAFSPSDVLVLVQGSAVYGIDLVTGAATPSGSLSFDPGAGGAAFDPAGMLWAPATLGRDQDSVIRVTDIADDSYVDIDTDIEYLNGVTYGDVEIEYGTALVKVTKEFSDSASGDVEVTLTCNGGSPLVQSFTISGGGPGVTFTVSDLPEAGANCEVTESGGPDGYTPVFNGGSGCAWSNVTTGFLNCAITNVPSTFDFVVDFEWDDTAGEATGSVDVSLYCTNVVNPDGSLDMGTRVSSGYTATATTDTEFTWMDVGAINDDEDDDGEPVDPTTCWAVASGVTDSAVEVSGCDPFTVSLGDDEANCTMTASMFFEGIPTLSQYGMAIMALLMLGMGFVGFRRFV